MRPTQILKRVKNNVIKQTVIGINCTTVLFKLFFSDSRFDLFESLNLQTLFGSGDILDCVCDCIKNK